MAQRLLKGSEILFKSRTIECEYESYGKFYPATLFIEEPVDPQEAKGYVTPPTRQEKEQGVDPVKNDPYYFGATTQRNAGILHAIDAIREGKRFVYFRYPSPCLPLAMYIKEDTAQREVKYSAVTTIKVEGKVWFKGTNPKGDMASALEAQKDEEGFAGTTIFAPSEHMNLFNPTKNIALVERLHRDRKARQIANNARLAAFGKEYGGRRGRVASAPVQADFRQLDERTKMYMRNVRPLRPGKKPKVIGIERAAEVPWAAVHLPMSAYSKTSPYKPLKAEVVSAYEYLVEVKQLDGIPIENVAFCPARSDRGTNSCARVSGMTKKNEIKFHRADTAPALSVGGARLETGRGKDMIAAARDRLGIPRKRVTDDALRNALFYSKMRGDYNHAMDNLEDAQSSDDEE